MVNGFLLDLNDVIICANFGVPPKETLPPFKLEDPLISTNGDCRMDGLTELSYPRSQQENPVEPQR